MLEVWYRTGAALLCSAVLLALVFLHSLAPLVDFPHAELFYRGLTVHLFFAAGIMVLSSKRCSDTVQPAARHKICGLLLLGILTVSAALYALTFSGDLTAHGATLASALERSS